MDVSYGFSFPFDWQNKLRFVIDYMCAIRRRYRNANGSLEEEEKKRINPGASNCQSLIT
jgi:hypothetical protein